MNLYTTIDQEIKTAMMAKDKIKLETLRSIKTAFMETTTAKGAAHTGALCNTGRQCSLGTHQKRNLGATERKQTVQLPSVRLFRNGLWCTCTC